MRFDAGQHVTIEFDMHGVRISRCYTISSSPTGAQRLSIPVKQAGEGRV